MKYIIFFSLIIFLPLATAAQFLPEHLSAAVNSDYDEINPVISPSGDTLYFTRVNHPQNTFGKDQSQDIWFTVKADDGTWKEAQRLPDHVNIGRYNAIFSISPDGKKALINGVYNRKGTWWKKRGLSVITKTSGGWSKPEELKVRGLQRMMDSRYFSADMHWEKEVIVMSFEGSFNSKKSNLFVSKKEGDIYGKPTRIKTLDVQGNEFAPFIAADGETLYYASNSKGGYDIIKAVREGDSWKSWNTTASLSDTINTVAHESFFTTAKKNSLAYYSSDRKLAGNKDIYFIKLFEPNPFVLVKGQVKYKDSDIPVAGREITLHVNDRVADSVEVDEENGTFKLLLPLGEDYLLKAIIPDADVHPVAVATSGLKEYTEMALDLYVSPWQYAKVSGRLIEKNTGLTPNFSPQIMINGKQTDQIIIEQGTGKFETTFALGSTYKIKALKEGYLSPETNVDLRDFSEYVELEKNIVVEKIKEATVTGKIVNKKTLEPLDSAVEVQILVNNEPGIVKIDPYTQEYKLTIPLGKLYTLNAKAENFYPQSEEIDLSAETQNVKIYRDLYLNPLEIGGTVKLDNITFEPAKAVLRPSSYVELTQVVDFLRENEKLKIQVAGHTDSDGSEATNQTLSNLRAKAVKDYIVSQQIDPSRISHIGYGETSPIADNTTEEGKRQNRRVEFIVVENK